MSFLAEGTIFCNGECCAGYGFEKAKASRVDAPLDTLSGNDDCDVDYSFEKAITSLVDAPLDTSSGDEDTTDVPSNNREHAIALQDTLTELCAACDGCHAELQTAINEADYAAKISQKQLPNVFQIGTTIAPVKAAEDALRAPLDALWAAHHALMAAQDALNSFIETHVPSQPMTIRTDNGKSQDY